MAVESQTVDRTPVEPLVDPDAQAGARWGQPAIFDQASRPRASDEPVGFTVDWVDTYRVFKGTETHREYSRVAAGETEPEGIRSVTFYSRQPEGAAQRPRRHLHERDPRLREVQLPRPRLQRRARRAASATHP